MVPGVIYLLQVEKDKVVNVFFWKIELYVSCTVFVREELSDNVCCLGQCLTVINIKALLASFEIF